MCQTRFNTINSNTINSGQTNPVKSDWFVYKNLVLSNELIKVELPPWKI